MKSNFYAIVSVILLLFVSQLSSAQHKTVVGEGPIISKKITLPEISKIGLSLPADVYLTQGNKQDIEIKGQKNIIDLILTSVNNGSWEIKTSDEIRLKNIEKLEIYITLQTIEALAIGGSGNIYTKSTFRNAEHINLAIGGSGNIEMNVEAEEIKASIGGSGSIILNGKSEHLKVSLAGSGRVEGEDLITNNCDVSSAGSGDISIHVNGQLNASLAGSGDIKYKGSPNVKKSIAGSGSLVSIER